MSKTHRLIARHGQHVGDRWIIQGDYSLTAAQVQFLTGATTLEIHEAAAMEIIIRPEREDCRGIKCSYRGYGDIRNQIVFGDWMEWINSLSAAIYDNFGTFDQDKPFMIECRLLQEASAA